MTDWTKEFKKFLEDNGIDADAFLKRSAELYLDDIDEPAITKPVTERNHNPARMITRAFAFSETETAPPYRHTIELNSAHSRHRFWRTLSNKWEARVSDVKERTTQQ